MLGEGSSSPGGIDCDEWPGSSARRYMRRTPRCRSAQIPKKERGCFQGAVNELFIHTQLDDETSPDEQKGSLNTLPTRTVVMKTSHETSTGAAKQTWSTSSLGGSWALRKNVNLTSIVGKCECRSTHSHLWTHAPQATEPAHNGPTVSHPLGAQNTYLSATLLPN